MSTLNPSDRRLIARLAAHASWAQTCDRTARTAPVRAALLIRFENEVDPDRKLLPGERRRRAESARKAYYAALALKSAQARQACAAAASSADQGQPAGGSDG